MAVVKEVSATVSTSGGDSISDKSNFDNNYLMSCVSQIYNNISEWVPDEHVSIEELSDLIATAVKYCDTSFTAADAVSWAGDYQFPHGLVSKDHQDLVRHGGDFTAMVRERHGLMVGDRLNYDRLEGWPSGDPAKVVLHSLVPGMEVPVDSKFVPCNKPPKLREKYLDVAPAVNKMITALADQGMVILLPTDVACKIPGVHFSPISWVPKFNKAQGRPVVDSSYAKDGVPLNTPEVTEKGEGMWGEIRHPSLSDLMEMVLLQVDIAGWEDLTLWKMDLANAFGLLFIKPEDCRLMAFELSEGVTAIYIVGLFGWTGTPFAFDPVSRSLRFVLRRRLDGGLDMFEDDLMGCTRITSLKNDMDLASAAINDLLGSKAVALDKSVDGRVLDFIGWSVDLNKKVVGVAPKNLYKALYGFCMVDLNSRVLVNKLEQLGSWATRYSEICRALKPFVHSFYRNIPYMKVDWKKYKKGHGTFRNISVEWKSEAMLDVLLWRAFLCLSHLRPEGFARPIASFRHAAASLSIEFDASLEGFGFITGREIKMIRKRSVWCGFMHDYGFKEGDSSYQNSMEFIAVVLAIGSLVLNGIRDISVLIVGDSTTALHWAFSEKTKSPKTRAAATLLLMLTVKFNITIVGERWLSGKNNVMCDLLSRSFRPETLAGHEKIFDIKTSEWMMRLVKLCDPTKAIETEHDFTHLWRSATDLCDELHV